MCVGSSATLCVRATALFLQSLGVAAFSPPQSFIVCFDFLPAMEVLLWCVCQYLSWLLRALSAQNRTQYSTYAHIHTFERAIACVWVAWRILKTLLQSSFKSRSDKNQPSKFIHLGINPPVYYTQLDSCSKTAIQCKQLTGWNFSLRISNGKGPKISFKSLSFCCRLVLSSKSLSFVSSSLNLI